MTKREIWYWLSTLPSWEGKTVGRVLEGLGSLEAVWNARQLPVTPAQQREAEERRREPERLAEELEALEQRGIRFVCGRIRIFRRVCGGGGTALFSCLPWAACRRRGRRQLW